MRFPSLFTYFFISWPGYGIKRKKGKLNGLSVGKMVGRNLGGARPKTQSSTADCAQRDGTIDRSYNIVLTFPYHC